MAVLGSKPTAANLSWDSPDNERNGSKKTLNVFAQDLTGFRPEKWAISLRNPRPRPKSSSKMGNNSRKRQPNSRRPTKASTRKAHATFVETYGAIIKEHVATFRSLGYKREPCQSLGGQA